MSGEHRLTLRLDGDTWDRICDHARRDGQQPTAWVKELIRTTICDHDWHSPSFTMNGTVVGDACTRCGLFVNGVRVPGT